MKTEIYLVGGAVRDELLGKKSSDLDYVVVGSNPEKMVKKGFTQVGADFPVFLHPETGDEYALARTERKVESGYNGFTCEWEGVSLKEDLSRRDLTINALAKDDGGTLYDYFNGLRDLSHKKLRHVSDAFKEDPVRILRVARFLAKMPEFTVADETKELIVSMVKNGDLKEVTKERVWKEFHRAMEAESPVRFFQALDDFGALNDIFPILEKMKGVPQRADFHAEGDVFIHNLMVLEEATKLTKDFSDQDKLLVRMGALLHDVGKTETEEELLYNEDGSMRGSHTNHDSIWRVKPIIDDIAEQFKMPEFIKRFCLDVAVFHQQIHGSKVFKDKSFFKMFEKMNLKNKANSKGDDFYLEMLLLTCKADAFGRLETLENGYIVPASKVYEQENIIKEKYFLYKNGIRLLGLFLNEYIKKGLKHTDFDIPNLKRKFVLIALKDVLTVDFEDFLTKKQKSILKTKEKK